MKLKFYLVTHDKLCQILVSLPLEYVAMVDVSATHQYCQFSCFWAYGRTAHSYPFGHLTGFGQ